ncbi:MAG TPA: adenosylhomocysteinase [Candidatus Nanoarchaeia archaeon]|nr:adenosylhomocysteinase [Candidatus Nanoarchaeia archaeon]
MDKGSNYEVKDMKLAGQGKLNIEIAESRMQALIKVKQKFQREKPLKGTRIGMALHVTKETAVLVRTLIAGGAEVAITGCNPLSTQDDVAAALAEENVKVWAYKGESKEDYYRYLNEIISFKPNITIDDGCDLVSEIHKKHAHLIKEMIAGCEETTTGIIRLKAMERDNALKYPMIAVNDNKTKHLLDNYIGTGESTWDGIKRGTNVLVSGKSVVVAGYGSCGKGVALRAKGMGASVIVTEVDPFRALQALYDGYQVMKMDDAAKVGDIFITVTGDINVIKTRHMEKMKDGAIICNSGHFDVEIDYKGLKSIANSMKEVRPLVEDFTLKNGHKITCLAQGRLVNLSLAEGHPSEVMDTSFCGQALACEFAAKNKEKMKPEVIQLPEEIDNHIAELKLEAYGVEIDKLDEEQIKYLNSWEEGT